MNKVFYIKKAASWDEVMVRNEVGQSLQRAFDANGVFKARYSDVPDLLNSGISQSQAQPHISYYNDNVDELKEYRQ